MAEGNMSRQTLTRVLLAVAALAGSACGSGGGSSASDGPTTKNQPPVARLTVTPTHGVAPLVVNADTADSRDPDGSIASVRIDFADGTAIDAASGSHTYTSIGGYTVVATVTDDKGATATASVQVVVGATATETVSASLVPSRTSGYPPLAVFFDATGATSSEASIMDIANGGAFHRIKHAFDFGDPDSGTHSLDGTSKNSEPLGGGLAAHVFDKPGKYTVTVTSTDGIGTPVTKSVEITVGDPSKLTTYAVSKAGDFTDAPAGAQLLTELPTLESNSRYFFRRGEDWSRSEIRIQDPSTNIEIDAFGKETDAKPIFDVVNVGIFRPSSSRFVNDIRISNIHAINGFHQELGSRVLFYKCEADHSSQAGMSYLPVDLYRVVPQEQFENPHELFFVDCVLDEHGADGHYVFFGSGSRLVFLNTFMGGCIGGTTRIVAWNRGVMRHCHLESPYEQNSFAALKLHSGGTHEYDDNWLKGTGGDSGVYGWKTSKVVIAGTRFGGGKKNASWTLAICPTNSSPESLANELIEDAIIENSEFVHLPGSTVEHDIAYSAYRLSIRHNSAVWGGGGSGDISLRLGVGHDADWMHYTKPLWVEP